MTQTDERFEFFRREHDAWDRHTEALPFRRDHNVPKCAFELDLDHFIDYVRPVLTAGLEHSTQFDYPKVADEYLSDLDHLTPELKSASLSASERDLYTEYLTKSRSLLRSLGALPVPLAGHLGFRKHALEAFRFLIDEYGFKVVESSPITVRFATDVLFINLSYSPECPMDSVWIGKHANDEEPVSGFILDDFAYVAGQGVFFDYGRFNFRDPESVAEFLKTAARLLHWYGVLVLQGNPEAIHDLHNKADERERLYVEMMERQHSSPH